MAIKDCTAWPFTEIQDVTCTDVNGYRHAMVKFPKFYYKRTMNCGGKLNGNDAWLISKTPLAGFHIHPAFMYQGAEQEYICIGKYALRGTAPNIQTHNGSTDFYETILDAMSSSCKSLGNTIHLWTVYELFVIQLLFLIDKVTTDYQGTYNTTNELKVATASDNWRGISEISNSFQWVDGIKVSKSLFGNLNWHMYDNQGNGQWLDTGVTSDNWFGWGMKPFYNTKGLNWDLCDTFMSQNAGYANAKSPFGCDVYNVSIMDECGCGLDCKNGAEDGLYGLNMGWNLICGAGGRIASYKHD